MSDLRKQYYTDIKLYDTKLKISVHVNTQYGCTKFNLSVIVLFKYHRDRHKLKHHKILKQVFKRTTKEYKW